MESTGVPPTTGLMLSRGTALQPISRSHLLQRFADLQRVVDAHVDEVLAESLGGLDVDALLDEYLGNIFRPHRPCSGNGPVPLAAEQRHFPNVLEWAAERIEADRAVMRANAARARRQHRPPPLDVEVRTPVTSGQWKAPEREPEFVLISQGQR